MVITVKNTASTAGSVATQLQLPTKGGQGGAQVTKQPAERARASHVPSPIADGQSSQGTTRAETVPPRSLPSVPGATNDVNKVVATLCDKRSGVMDALATLADMSGTSYKAVDNLHAKLADNELTKLTKSMSKEECATVAAKLGSKNMRTLQATLQDGDLKSMTKSEGCVRLLRSMGGNLTQLQRHFGVSPAGARKANALERMQANRSCQQFVKKYEQSTSSASGRLSAAEIGKQAPEFTKMHTAGGPAGVRERFSPHEKHPHLTEQFALDLLRNNYVVDHGGGDKQFLIPKDLPRTTEEECDFALEIAAKRVLEFTGGDEEKCFQLSALANQSTMSTLTDMRDQGINIPNLPTTKSGGSALLNDNYQKTQIHVLGRDAEGNHTVTSKMLSSPAGHYDPFDVEGDLGHYNPRASAMQTQTTFRLGTQDNKIELVDVAYNFNLVKEFKASDFEQFQSSLNRHDKHFNHEVTVEAEKIPTGANRSFKADFDTAEKASKSAEQTALLISSAKDDGALDESQARNLHGLLEFADNTLREGQRLAVESRVATTQLAGLQSDIELMVNNLGDQRELWEVSAPEGAEQRLNTAVATVLSKLGDVQQHLAILAS